MAKHEKDFNPQQQHMNPPLVDEIAQRKQEAAVKEVLGRHKNSGQNEHASNMRQQGTPSGKA